MRLPTYKSLVPEQPLMKRDSCYYTLNHKLVKRPLHTRNGRFACICPDYEFG